MNIGAGFCLGGVVSRRMRRQDGECDVPTPGTAMGIIMVLPNSLAGGWTACFI
jgi:hypothetical protein